MDFPKYQYSRFIGQDQIVIRSNDKAEFEGMLTYVNSFGSGKTKIKEDPTESWNVPTPTQEYKTPTESLGFCKDCGGNKIIGKNGKPYCKPCYIKWANANKK